MLIFFFGLGGAASAGLLTRQGETFPAGEVGGGARAIAVFYASRKRAIKKKLGGVAGPALLGAPDRDRIAQQCLRPATCSGRH